MSGRSLMMICAPAACARHDVQRGEPAPVDEFLSRS
jgi:hypothetical protein